MNVLVLNVFNIRQERNGWNGRLRDEKACQTRISEAFEEVVELSPKDGIWQAACEESPALEPHSGRVIPPEILTYTRRGGYAPVPTTGARIDLVV